MVMRSNANFIELTLLLKIMLKPKKELLLTISIHLKQKGDGKEERWQQENMIWFNRKFLKENHLDLENERVNTIMLYVNNFMAC